MIIKILENSKEPFNLESRINSISQLQANIQKYFNEISEKELKFKEEPLPLNGETLSLDYSGVWNYKWSEDKFIWTVSNRNKVDFENLFTKLKNPNLDDITLNLEYKLIKNLFFIVLVTLNSSI